MEKPFAEAFHDAAVVVLRFGLAQSRVGLWAAENHFSPEIRETLIPIYRRQINQGEARLGRLMA